MPTNPQERTKNSAIKFALSMSKRPKFADGGIVGPLHDVAGGRTDTLPITVAAGSYILPADVVSGLPGAEGNSLAGHNALNKLFSSQPFMPDQAPYGAAMPKLKKGKLSPKAKGGKVSDDEAAGKPVEIMAAGGEYAIPPEVVRKIGAGDIKRGHEILDMFVKHVREQNIKELKKLPDPVKK